MIAEAPSDSSHERDVEMHEEEESNPLVLEPAAFVSRQDRIETERARIDALRENLHRSQPQEKKHSPHGPHKFVVESTKDLSGQGRFLGSSKLAETKASMIRGALKWLVNAKIGAGDSFMEQITKRKEGIAAHEYEIKDDIKAVANFYAELSEDGRNGNMDVMVATEKAWEEKDSKSQAEILVALMTLKEEMEELNGTPNVHSGPGAVWDTSALIAYYDRTIHHLRSRFASGRREEVEKKQEGPLAFHRQQFDDLSREGDTKKLLKYFGTLSSSQRAGLRLEQATHRSVRHLLSGKDFVALDNSGNMNTDSYQEIGHEVMDRQIAAVISFGKILTENRRGDRLDLLASVNEYLSFNNEPMISTTNEDAATEAAISYFKKNLLGKYLTTAAGGRTTSRTYASNYGANGEALNRKITEIIRSNTPMPPISEGRGADLL